MKILLSLFLLFLFYSCSQVSLEDDPVVKKHFSDSEIIYLDSILSFFDSEIVSQTPESEDLFESYSILFRVIKDSLEAKNPVIPFLEINDAKLESLLIELPDSLKENIWYSGYSYNSSNGDSSRFRYLYPFGKYGKFINSASAKNEFVAIYYDDLITTQSISPSMTANLLLFPEKIDLKKERERLIYAIHLITIYKPSTH